ncbi:hypothetical protein FA95DRAFT_1566110 [Auriscalpium vulgare]|uniref:Uncharacterized protein n=1 Tax=Auriscalpium vulgare TaxID=40419 RepID=A0ACB8RA51_9AGAM|nr:hypothetical protein FA95DRAFT_1566110 [Auriscalpium vulgare]
MSLCKAWHVAPSTRDLPTPMRRSVGMHPHRQHLQSARLSPSRTDRQVRAQTCAAIAGNLERGWAAHAPVMLPWLDTLALGSVRLKRRRYVCTYVRAFMLQRGESERRCACCRRC